MLKIRNFLAFLSFYLFFVCFCTQLASANTTKQNAIQILVYGDSLSAAYNIPREQGWVSLLQDFVTERKLPIQLTNASISGETTSGGLERFPKQLQQVKPDIVILELGGNDGLRGFDLNVTRKNLQSMIEQSHQIGAQVLLAGIELPPNLGRTYTSRFKNIYRDLAQLDNVQLIPFILEGVATNPALMQRDGIHPTASGQPVIAQTVWKHLGPMVNQNTLQFVSSKPAN